MHVALFCRSPGSDVVPSRYLSAMNTYSEQYASLVINADGNMSGQVLADLSVTGGSVAVTGQVAGDLRVSGGQVNLSGNVVGCVYAQSGTVDITGITGRVVLGGGTVTLAVGCCVDGRVLNSDGRWVSPGGIWAIESATPRFSALEVL